jgi:hypothetical protein
MRVICQKAVHLLVRSFHVRSSIASDFVRALFRADRACPGCANAPHSFILVEYATML